MLRDSNLDLEPTDDWVGIFSDLRLAGSKGKRKKMGCSSNPKQVLETGNLRQETRDKRFLEKPLRQTIRVVAFVSREIPPGSSALNLPPGVSDSHRVFRSKRAISRDRIDYKSINHILLKTESANWLISDSP
jgi:hypothetical protein